jgi:hypothetical protein
VGVRLHRRRDPEARRRATVALALTASLALGACAVRFGPDPSESPGPDGTRDRNRLYLEEQQRLERQRVFDRSGPSER